MKAVTKVTDRIEAAQPRRSRPYPEYKDSGVEWLGEIPVHWDVKRLKTTASVQLSNVDKHSEEGQVPVKLCNYVDVYYNDLITAELKFMKATATPEQVQRFPLRVGDVLITKDSESWTDIAVPAVVGEDLSDVLCGYHLAHIKPGPDLDGRFLGPPVLGDWHAVPVPCCGEWNNTVRSGWGCHPHRPLSDCADRRTTYHR